jgi:DNA-binding response OmpR family regulator
MKALVVEKSGTMRSVLRRMLSMRGFEVAEAENDRQAWDVLHGIGTADIVLVNWTPHESDNLEFIMKLRHEVANDVMVIMLATSEPVMRELYSALIAGADDYLITPFTSQQMDEKLAKAGLIFRQGECCDWRGIPCRQ